MALSYFDLIFDIPSSQTFTYQIDDKALAAVGKRAMVPFGRRDCLGFIIARKEELPPLDIKPEAVKKIRRVVDSEILFDQKDIEIAFWMADFYFCGAGQALRAMIPSGRKGIEPDLASYYEEEERNTLSISGEQAAALREITIDRTRPGVPDPAAPLMFYLYGVTGSGKTEVFLRAAQHMLNAGKSVIYLVPEISLTHQTAKMIASRFGQSALAIHSGMSPSSRLAQWIKIRKTDAKVVIGPRSAVFAPVPNLGLIIIDEEHDSSYKSGNTPRYHARQIAHKRCQSEGARMVMGSATPSAEAWKLMADGYIKRLDLLQRVSGGSMPEIKPVNLSKTSGCLTKELKEEIRVTAGMGKQTILFLNRRGFAYFYQCPQCGWELTCKRCSVSLTWHKSRGRCICHYCGYFEAPPSLCPKCGCVEAGYRGFGTEMIEDEVKRAFPDLRIRRIDADTASKKTAGETEKINISDNEPSPRLKNLEETLSLFKTGVIDILLGTQMVAKGLNFPGVRLVGVIFADTGLHLPDFRAAERTFSLIVQVAGRAGRYFPDSKVIVQTLRLDDPVISRSCALDVKGFFDAELKQRKALGFPPYSRLIRFTVRSKEESRASAAINRISSIALSMIQKNSKIDMLGPAECPIGIINNNYRRHLILRCPSMNSLQMITKEILPRYEKGKDAKTYLEIDVDPVSML
ncbi:MAG: primosomal protein N' [Treponema sp.]|nr:primosomal protein N' [Treponema sp.]